MSYQITPIQGGMSVRRDHSTFEEKINTLLSTEKGFGTELWTAAADGLEVKKGDQWLHITKAGTRAVDGWVAVVHKGERYCNLLEVIDPTPNPDQDAVKQIISAVVTYETVGGEIKTQDMLPSD